MSNNYVVKDGTGTSFNFKSVDIGTSGNVSQVPQNSPVDINGNPFAADNNPFSVATQCRLGTWTDKSGTLSGTNSQQICASNTSRKGFYILNLDPTNILWINIGSAASAGSGSIPVFPYSDYKIPVDIMSSAAIFAIGINSQAFTAKEIT